MGFHEQASMGFLFAEVVRFHYQRLHFLLGQLGLYPGQPWILHLLWRQDGRTQKELAEKTQLRPATITVMLQRMERAGFIQRKVDTEDLRVSRVYLTEKGRQLQPQVEAVLKTLDQESLHGFSSREREQLRGYLQRLRDNLKKE